MSGGNLADVINLAPAIFLLGGVAMFLRALGSNKNNPRQMIPVMMMMLCGIFMAAGPSVILEMLGLNKDKLGFGEYVQQEMTAWKKLEIAQRPRANLLNRDAEGSQSSQPANARLESGVVGQESESSAHVETRQPKPLPPTPAAEPAKAAPIIEKLASPEEARSAADAKALWEVCLGVAVALGAGAAAWIAARRKRAALPEEALPNVQFLDAGRNAAFAESDIFAKTAAFHKAKAQREQP